VKIFFWILTSNKATLIYNKKNILLQSYIKVLASRFNTPSRIARIETLKTLFLIKYKRAAKEITCWSIKGTTLSWFLLDSCLLSFKTVVIRSAGRSTATAVINPPR
jgi:hypothetical protein